MTEVVIRNRGRAELFSFGQEHRRLFGAFHAAVTPCTRSVLLCSPFGQEAIRLHRLFRVLADRLARQGISTLRFDYFGTGDSDGDDRDGDLDGWALDVVTAHHELASRTQSAPATWVGAGLGATLAASAAPRASEPPARLVLWDPVLGGHAYLADLRTKHVETLEASFSVPDRAWRRAIAEDDAAFSEEAMGFALPPLLRQGIEKITPDTLGHGVSCSVDVLADPGNDAARAWTNGLFRSRRRAFHPLTSDFEWAAEELRGAALVPSQALKTLLAVCQET